MVTNVASSRLNHRVQHILSLYEDCPGQIINKEKSSIMFSKNARSAEKQQMMTALGINVEARNEKYLGLPVYMGRSKEKTFAYLKDVAQAISSYAMSCFDLTKSLCDDIMTMICRFWWAQQDQENKMHWLSKEKLCTRKENGGLGFRDLHLFNLAMLARQGWRLIISQESLCAQVLRAKYFPDGNLMGAKEKPRISYSWRSIVRGVQALKEGLI